MTAIPNHHELPARRNRPDLNKLLRELLKYTSNTSDPLKEKSQETRKGERENKTREIQGGRFVEGVCGVLWMEKEPLCPLPLGKMLPFDVHGWICSWRCGTAGACRATQNFSGSG